MRDIRWLTPAVCRSWPYSIYALPGRAFGSLVLVFCLLAGLSSTAEAQTYTLTVSPTTSTDGSYTVSWTAPLTDTASKRLSERVGSTGSWKVLGTYSSSTRSKSFTDKAAGTYWYKLERCSYFFGSYTCWDVASPVSVTVTSPKPTASISWSPASVAYGSSSTLSWSSTNATACYLNDTKRTTSGNWLAKNRTVSRTDSLYCTGPGGTSATVSTTLTITGTPKPTASISWSPASIAYGGSSTLSWSSTNATTCYLNGNSFSTRGNWLAKDRTASRTDSFYCTGPGGTSTTKSATLTVDPPPANRPDTPARPTLTGGVLQFTANWTAPADNGSAITDYTLQYRLGSGTWRRTTTGSTATRATVSVSAAGTYTVHVRAKNDEGWSDFSRGATVTVRKPDEPEEPDRPTVKTGTGELHVTWSAPDDNGSAVTAYGISYKRDGSTTQQHPVTGLTRRTSIPNLTNGATYRIRVRAQNAGGWSDWSDDTVGVPLAAPDASGPATSTGSHTISWDSATGATGYTVRARKGTSGSWAEHDAGTATSKAFDAVDSGAWTYQAQACNAGGCGDWGDAVTVSVSPPALTVTPTTSTDGDYTVSWTQPTAGLARTRLWARQDGGAWAVEGLYLRTVTSKAFTDQPAGVYEYKSETCLMNFYGTQIRSCTDAGGPVRVTVNRAPATPATPTGPATSTGTHTVSWTAVTGATRYRVRESGDNGQNWTVSAYQSALTRTFKDKAAGTWRYQVQACTNAASQCSAWSASLTITVSAPTTLTVTPTDSPDGNYTVRWNAPAYSAITLRLWQQVEKNGKKAAWTVVGTYPGTTTSKAFSQGTTPATYYYKAEHCITVFGIQSCWNETAAVSVTVGATPAVTTPAIPAGLAGTTPDARGNYTVSWTAVNSATSYKLQESDDGGTSWDNEYTLTTGTSRAFTDKDPGDWAYAVRACNAAPTPCSEWSPTLPVTVPKPAAPENLTHTRPTSTGNYTVSWSAVTHATRYQLQESSDNGKTWATTYPIATGTKKDFTNKSRGAWTYRARACRVRGTTCGDWSSTRTVSVSTPTPPTNLSATTPDVRGQYTLSWDAVTGATHYKVQESTDGGSTWPNEYRVNSGVQLAFTDKAPGTRHYQVNACDAQACSPWGAALPITVPRLAPPENLTATTPDADGDYAVSWDAVTHATRYDVRESDDGGHSWAATYAIPRGTTQALTGKTPGAWDYQVRACRPARATCSDWSETHTVTVPGPPAQPAAPALIPGDEQLSVTWTAPEDNGSPLTGYHLRYQADTDSVWTGHTPTGTDTETVIRELTNGVAYTVQVQAVNARGTSPWSEGADATPAAYLTPPTGLAAPPVSDGTHTVRWKPSPGATCYVLTASNDAGQSWTTHAVGEITYKDFSAVPAGVWTYRVRACNGQQTGNWSNTVSVTVGTGGIPAPPAPATTSATKVVSATAQTNSDTVGTLPGSFRVTEQGSASYRIDLSLPPGTAGVTPPLALAYDSQRGNGLLGVGWALEGLSSITRCRQTLSQDGAAQPLTFTKTDRFCLDGQRLVLSDGTANNNREYGDPGTEYQTEIDSFLIVTAKDGTAGHPDYFEVQRKDGSVALYGAAGKSAAEHKLYANLTDQAPTDKVLTWAVQEVKDSVGNKITYHYTLDKDGHRLTHIRYAYGDPDPDSATHAHKAEVALAYTTDRKDPSAGYLAGYPLRHVLRLDTITLSSAAQDKGKPANTLTPLRRYTLRYEAPHTLSRLVGIKACTGTNWGACLPETAVAWSDPNTGFNTSAKSLTLNTEGKWTPVDYNPADINGDGHTDLVWTETKGSKHRLRYALANKATGQWVARTFVGGGLSLEYDDDYGTSDYGENLRVHTEVVDYNGDGRHDLLVYSTKADQTRVHLAVPQSTGTWRLSGTGITLFSGRYRYADINSDGLLDAYRLVENPPLPPKEGETARYAPSGYTLAVRYLQRNDSAKPESSRYYAYTEEALLPLEFTPQAATVTGLDLFRWRSLRVADAALADVDGDGRADLITWGYDSVRQFDLDGGYNIHTLRRLHVFRQTGGDKGVEFKRYSDEAGLPLAATEHSPKGVRSADINQDGLSDLIYFIGNWYEKKEDNFQWTGNWHYRLSTGAGFTDATQLTHVAAGAQAPSSLSLYDDNGDGYPDVLWHDVKAKQVSLKHYNPTTGAFASGDPTKVRATLGKDEEQYFTADVNGDGQADLLHVADSGDTESLKTYLHQSTSRPHFVSAITNGLGAKTTLTYESLSRTDAYARIDGVHTTKTGEDRCFTWGSARFCWPVTTATLNVADFYTALNTPWADTALTDPMTATTGTAPVLELMGPLYVVTRVDSSAPTGTDANATSSICYMYEQAKLQAAGRGLLGFKALTTIDLQTGVATTTTYRQDFPYIGYPLKTEVKTRDGHLLRTAANTWQLQGYDESWNSAGPTAALGALQPYLAKAVETIYDLPAAKTENGQRTTEQGAKLSTVTTGNTYDDGGNPTNITVTTEDHANGKAFRQTTANTYGSTTDAKRFGRLTEATVTRARDFNGDDDYSDNKEALTRTSTFSYHTTGNHKRLLKTETLEPDNTRLKHETTYHYDKFGHRTRAVVTAAADADGYTTETRCKVDTLTYDTHGRHVIKETDCLGQDRRALSGHNAWGQPTTVKRFLNAKQDNTNAVTTTHTYTPGGWLAVSRESTGAYTGRFRAECTTSSDPYCPTGTAYFIETRQAGGGKQWEYRDTLDRVMRTRTAGFDEDTWLLTDMEYDALGRVARQSEPYYAGTTPYWTTYHYDLLGRVVKTTLPDYETDANDAVTVNSVITTAYNGFTTTTTNGKGQRQSEIRNALGEVIKSTDHAGTPVTHTYDAWGQVIETATGAGTRTVSVAWEYDARGRRTAVKDPHRLRDSTRYTYTYNGFDELIAQTDRLGNEQIMTYDALGRLLSRKDYALDGYDPALVATATWTYDGAENGLGQVHTVARQTQADDKERNQYDRTHNYDAQGRESVTTLTVETAHQYGSRLKTYTTQQTYDAWGRPYQSFDARLERAQPAEQFTDNVTAVHYNARGYAYRWTDGVVVKGTPRRTYREITALDARGQITGETLGGGVVRTRRSHDVKTGRIEGITTTDALMRTAQADTYGWDVLGNLTARTAVVGDNTLAETYEYDTLNRLVKANTDHTNFNPETRTTTTQTLTPQTVTYDALGNITKKSDVGTYSYHAAHPYAVDKTEVKDQDNNTTSTYYNYDALGNQVSGAGRSLGYTSFNKVKRISRGTATQVYFTYGPARSRLTRTDITNTGNGRTTTTTVYLGNVEHVIAEDGSSTWKRYLAGGSVLITQDHDTRATRTAETTHYLLKDHLGSLTALLDKYGTGIDSFSYDAWGQRRTPGTAAMLALLTLRSALHSQITPRGYTGHEMLDAHGIIHMNGRIYDPRLGRFLQADPIVQFPNYSQSWNTYSYVLNNPLTYTDPSGYFIGKLFNKVFKGLNKALGDFAPFLGIALLAIPVVRAWVISSWGSAFSFGFWTGGIASGSYKGALFGGISAAAFYGIGSQFAAEAGFFQQGGLGHVLTHGLAGGILAELQGGQFGHGFLAAGLSKAVMGRFSYADGSAPAVMGRTTIAAVVGGTISRITGGKFANGALTSAMAQLFNNELSNMRERKKFVNPTGKEVRGCDSQGCGEFNAPRGSRNHQGTDYIAVPGQDVLAVNSGTITKIGYPYGDDLNYRYIQIKSADGYQTREFYVTPAEGLSIGSRVSAGQVIGTAQSLQPRYPDITDHIHVEIRLNGKVIDPASVLP